MEKGTETEMQNWVGTGKWMDGTEGMHPLFILFYHYYYEELIDTIKLHSHVDHFHDGIFMMEYL